MSERAMGVPEVGAEIAEGKYRLVRLLGEGAAGSVFEAEHVVTQSGSRSKPYLCTRARQSDSSERLRSPGA